MSVNPCPATDCTLPEMANRCSAVQLYMCCRKYSCSAEDIALKIKHSHRCVEGREGSEAACTVPTRTLFNCNMYTVVFQHIHCSVGFHLRAVKCSDEVLHSRSCFDEGGTSILI